jgi:homoserine trans-succinylase
MFRLRKTVIELKFIQYKHEQMKEQNLLTRKANELSWWPVSRAIKSDNAELAAMEEQIKELLSKTERL